LVRAMDDEQAGEEGYEESAEEAAASQEGAEGRDEADATGVGVAPSARDLHHRSR